MIVKAKSAVITIALVGLAACTKVSDASLVYHELARNAVQLPDLACGVHALTPPDSLLLIPITARQCLSCQGVGYLLRRYEEKSSSMLPLALAASPQDTTTVCEYLRHERVSVPVIVTPSWGMGQGVLDKSFVLLLTDKVGHVDWEVRGDSLGVLLGMVESAASQAAE